LCCISAWQRRGNDTLIGVPHSSIRFWDLRYFFDPRIYKRNSNCDFPMPDKVAVNGPVAKDVYIRGGYPKNKIIEAEALRYLHLLDVKRKSSDVTLPSSRRITLLVITDYLIEDAYKQLSLLERCPLAFNNWDTPIKPHPCCQPLDISRYPRLFGSGATLSHDSLDKLFLLPSIVYCGSNSTAALEAYAIGVPVVSYLDPKSLNLSPIRVFDDAIFVSTPNQLAIAIGSPHVNEYIPNLFYLDDDLPKWKRILIEGFLI